MRELELAKLQRKYNLEQEKIQLRQNIANQKETIEEKKQTLEAAKQYKKRLDDFAALVQKRKLEGKNVVMYEQWLEKQQQANAQDIADAKLQLTQEEEKLKIYEKQEVLLNNQGNLINQMVSGVSAFLIPIMMVVNLYRGLTRAISTAILLKKKENAETQKGTVLERIKTA